MTATHQPPASGVVARLRREVAPLYRRSLRNTLRVPSTFIPPLFVPVFFLVVHTAQLGDNVAFGPPGGAAGGRELDYVAFFIPVSLMLTISSAGNSSGLAFVHDIASGFFDKLLLAPISRFSILVARLMVDGTRAALQALIIIAVGLALGADLASGLVGVLLAIALAFLFGMVFAGLSLGIALRTGSPEATQASFVLFFPMVFLSPTFVPLDALPGWLELVARCNPMTYVIEAVRAMFLVGIDWSKVAEALAATAVLGALSLGNAFRALRARARA